MKKLNETVYHKLLLQAQEAKMQGLNKLASGVVNALGPITEDENVKYSYHQLEDDIYEGLWKLATNVVKYYDVESVDAGKIHDSLEALANTFLSEVENSLGVEEVVAGPLEPTLPGETK